MELFYLAYEEYPRKNESVSDLSLILSYGF